MKLNIEKEKRMRELNKREYKRKEEKDKSHQE